MMFRRIDDVTFVAGQIGPEDVAEAKALGVVTIVNNRPDAEEAGQPTSAQIEAAARAAGLDYRHIPVGGGFSIDQVEAMATAIEEADGKILAFCRSGTRSTYLWALSRKARGADGATLIAQAEAASYDLTPLRPHLLG